MGDTWCGRLRLACAAADWHPLGHRNMTAQAWSLATAGVPYALILILCLRLSVCALPACEFHTGNSAGTCRCDVLASFACNLRLQKPVASETHKGPFPLPRCCTLLQSAMRPSALLALALVSCFLAPALAKGKDGFSSWETSGLEEELMLGRLRSLMDSEGEFSSLESSHHLGEGRATPLGGGVTHGVNSTCCQGNCYEGVNQPSFPGLPFTLCFSC
eukprot:1158931-Pelagomonas_calceolata.AAC.2